MSDAATKKFLALLELLIENQVRVSHPDAWWEKPSAATVSEPEPSVDS